MANIRLCDPSDPRAARRDKKNRPEKKGLASAIVPSAVAIVIMLYAMGFFPQVNGLFADLDSTLRGHNDAVVAAILHSAPLVLVLVGAFGLLAIAIQSVARAQPARKTQA